ncbi:MAG TPA: phospholipase D-like domain-containing protein [Geomonas sp.]|nr:phospholipase D-like domain-containing protein [Geomonas sp.]
MASRAWRSAGWLLCALLLCARPLAAQPPVQAALLANRAYGGELINRIQHSKRRILCAFYLFKVTEKRGNQPAAVAAELIRARARGVEVTVILEGGKTVWQANRQTAALLLRGGVKVLFPSRHAVTHAKVAVIDDRWLLIGSHNLTQSALLHNNELSVLLDSPELALQTKRYLENLR